MFVFSGISMAIVAAVLVAVSWSRWIATPTEAPISAGEPTLAVRPG